MLNPPLEDWKKAGKLTREIREWSKQLVKPGAKVLDIAEEIEKKIIDSGAFPAFPVNVSLNDVAAHDTAIPNDERVLKDEVVKIDLGVCYNGALGDTAYTVDLSGKYSKLVESSQKALQNVVDVIKPGMPINEIGKIIQETIQSYGFNPVFNLSGHHIEKFEVHASPNIPNFDNNNTNTLQPGKIIAIEPFASTGEGRITEAKQALIYGLISNKPIRDPVARKVIKYLETLNKLPFCERYIIKELNMLPSKVKYALIKLMQNGNIEGYPPLPEVSGGIISQAEHTFYIGEDEVIVLT